MVAVGSSRRFSCLSTSASSRPLQYSMTMNWCSQWLNSLISRTTCGFLHALRMLISALTNCSSLGTSLNFLCDVVFTANFSSEATSSARYTSAQFPWPIILSTLIPLISSPPKLISFAFIKSIMDPFLMAIETYCIFYKKKVFSHRNSYPRLWFLYFPNNSLFLIEIANIMFRKLNSLQFWFSRSKLRRGPKFDDKLKDYSSSYQIKKQINEQRQRFESSTQETFTSVLSNPKPKLKQRFKIDTARLNHDLKKMVKVHITPDNLQPYSEDGSDLKFLEEGKSYLNDQKAEVEFQQKFRKQLFMKNETERMLKRQANNYKHFLPENANNRYNKYLQAKMKLKNNRIDSMMNYKRNNEELQLLLDSGFMEEPSNIKMIIDKLNPSEGVEQISQRMEDEIKQIENSRVKSLSVPHEQSHSLKEQMDSHVVGPQQLRDYSKIQQFLDKYESSNQQDKLKAAQDVDLLLQVRDYQRNLFLSRYDQINFRFKGRVIFDNFKEFELLSYLKHENIQPLNLLELFDQEKERLSKFNIPIVTPAVMSRIYSKTSTYKFAENDENNHINLISHPTFIRLERTLFRELDKINDELYCDTVWTYAKNHEHEQGILNVNMSNAIQKAIFNQMLERVGRLRETDLGLLMRSLIKLNILKNEEYIEKWGEVIEVLKYRLPEMKQPYQYESVMEFAQLLPPTTSSVQIIASNINFFNKYAWEERGTLLTFARVCSNLINHNKLIEQLEHNKTFLRLAQILNDKANELKLIIPTLTINEISNVLIIFSELNKYPLAREIPPILVNIAKKEIVDSIHMQKHKVYQYTIPTIIATLSAYDYFKNTIKNYSKFIDSSDNLTPFQPKNIMKIVPLKHLLPGRVFVYNSKLYFIYHELAKFLETQSESLSLRSIAQSLHGLSLVQYKNEGIFDSMTYKVLQRLEKLQKQQKRQQLSFKQTIELIKIVNSYSLQKRNTNLIEEIYSKILKQGKRHFRNIPLNILINFFATYVNIFTLPTTFPEEERENYDYLLEKWRRNKAHAFIFTALYRDLFKDFIDKLENEELITLYLTHSQMLNNAARILESNQDYSIQTDFTEIKKRIKSNTVQLLRKVQQIPSEELKVDYRFAIGLCMKLNSLDLSQQELDLQSSWTNFEQIQRDFYNRYIQDILNHEQNVGSSRTYKQTYDNIAAKLKKQSPSTPIKTNTWRIEVQSSRTVYFIATFEHLMSKHNESQTSLALFGLWKIYAQIYHRQGWNFELVCSMLQ